MEKNSTRIRTSVSAIRAAGRKSICVAALLMTIALSSGCVRVQASLVEEDAVIGGDTETGTANDSGGNGSEQSAPDEQSEVTTPAASDEPKAVSTSKNAAGSATGSTTKPATKPADKAAESTKNAVSSPDVDSTTSAATSDNLTGAVTVKKGDPQNDPEAVKNGRTQNDPDAQNNPAQSSSEAVNFHTPGIVTGTTGNIGNHKTPDEVNDSDAAQILNSGKTAGLKDQEFPIYIMQAAGLLFLAGGIYRLIRTAGKRKDKASEEERENFGQEA